jgi:hypothetical protein
VRRSSASLAYSPRPRWHQHPTGANRGNRAQSTTWLSDGHPFLIVKDVNERRVVVRNSAVSALAPDQCREHGKGNAEDSECAQDKAGDRESAHGDERGESDEADGQYEQNNP